MLFGLSGPANCARNFSPSDSGSRWERARIEEHRHRKSCRGHPLGSELLAPTLFSGLLCGFKMERLVLTASLLVTSVRGRPMLSKPTSEVWMGACDDYCESYAFGVEPDI